MSTDWTVVCDRCKKFSHLGQRLAVNNNSFGYGMDDKKGRQHAADFIRNHVDYDKDLRITINDLDETYQEVEED